MCLLPMTSIYLPVAHHASACYVLVLGVIKQYRCADDQHDVSDIFCSE